MVYTKKEEISQRKDRILAMTIDQYVKSVSPVSSSCLVKEYRVDVSSATIRNILAELEDDGFLTHPHTSAGRVPTEKGYRYYVDNLMNEIQLLEDEKLRIKKEYLRDSNELEELIDRTTSVVSNVTNYTSIISIDGIDNKIFYYGTSHFAEYPEYQDIKKIKNILVALEEKEQLLDIINQELRGRVEVLIGHEMHYKQMQNCSMVISRYKTQNGPSGRIAVLGPTRMDYQRVVSTLDYLSEIMNEVL